MRKRPWTWPDILVLALTIGMFAGLIAFLGQLPAGPP